MRFALLLVGLLAGCTQPTHSTEWFAAHPEDTNRVLVQCAANRQTNAECDAAREAVRKKQDDRMKLFRKGF